MEIGTSSSFNRVASQIPETGANATDPAGTQSGLVPESAAPPPPDGTPATRSKNLPPDSAVPASIARALGLNIAPPQSGTVALDGPGLAQRLQEVERHIQRELQEQETREASLQGAQMLQTGGGGPPARMVRLPPFQMVRNGGWDAALTMAADPLGLLGELPGLMEDLHKLNRLKAESTINDMRQRLIAAGVKDVPTDYKMAWVTGGNIVRDYPATMDDLQQRYIDFLRDKRLQETWGPNYENIRLGKSRMTVQEFERRVLDTQQKAIDGAYDEGVEAIAKGKLPIKGDYIRTLGSYIDEQVRFSLRNMAKTEGIDENMSSPMWAINRRLSSDLVKGYGIPDNRLGLNLYADTTLARKTPYSEQIMRWNAIRPGSYLIMRPAQLGGSYVIPREAVPPMPRTNGKGI